MGFGRKLKPRWTDIRGRPQIEDQQLTAEEVARVHELAAISGTGLLLQTGDGYALRQLVGENGIQVLNPTGLNGNPRIRLTGNISGLANLVDYGIPVHTAKDQWTIRQLVPPASGIDIQDPAGIGGDPTFELTDDLEALENLASTGFATRTAANTWAQRSLAPPAAGIQISNPAGIAGNPTLALANDLAALEGLGATGIAVRTAADTWAQRQLVAPAAGFTITNNLGVGGNPTFALTDDLAALEALAGTGIAVRSALDTWVQRSIAGTANQVIVADGDGVGGNPTLSTPQDIHTGATPEFARIGLGVAADGTRLLTHADTFVLRTTAGFADGAAAAVGTLNNAPAAGDPTKWIPIDDNGTTRYIPSW